MQPPQPPPPRENANPIGIVITVLSSVAACLSLAIIAWVVWRFPHRPRPTTVVATADVATAGAAASNPVGETIKRAKVEPILADVASRPSDLPSPAGHQRERPRAFPGSPLTPNPSPDQRAPSVAWSVGARGEGSGERTSASNPYESSVPPRPQGKIDELVFAKLNELGIQPAPLCSDEVFVRRVYLDVIGTLPTVEEAKEFLRDRSPDKRRALIDQLLERDEFADYWTMKWDDVLRVKAEFPINLWPYAAYAYHHWIWMSVDKNKPYDKFVREILTACGSNFRVPQVNFFRALQSKKPPAIAQAVALAFMGMRADKWPAERLAGMAAFFSQVKYKSTAEWKEEIVFFDPAKKPQPSAPAVPGAPAGSAAVPAAPPAAAVFPDGTPAKLIPGKDPREVFADWLIDAKNPWFARQIVNRVWCWLLGRGIVHEPDDFRPDNPPQNPRLLDSLAEEVVSSHYDLKHIYRLILNSATYQLSPIPVSSIPKSKGLRSAENFAHYAPRRLDAEVLIDALCQMSGTTESYSSPIPEPFTWVPENYRTIALPDGSITSAFLEMFGRPPRDTGMESERNNRTTAAQRLHLLNSSHVRQKIEQLARSEAVARLKGKPRETVEELYLMILSRFPTDEERSGIQAYCGNSKNMGPKMVTDVAWALINGEEFLHRH
jgi:hypothetical protein